MYRYCQHYVQEDLKKKMIFIGGPRQVGKTTLSEALFPEYEYLNWDNAENRERILKKQWKAKTPLVIFDELHKYKRWKQWIKGIYDVKPLEQQYCVTGSARMDIYRRGGDSLMGRYHYWRLHPLTLDELPSGLSSQEGFHRLMTLGGFPEPFLANDAREARRWRRERFTRILREDVRDLEEIKLIHLLEIFTKMLSQRTGGLVTLSNIAHDLQISANTAKNWLRILERLYIAFSVYPLTTQIARAIQKPPKVYFYDNADVADEKGGRLENLVATHLLKRLHFIEDYYGHECKLHYIRDKEGREVDFVTLIDGKIYELIEVKSSDSTISTALKYYKEKLNPVHTIQLVGDLNYAFDQNGIQVMHPIDFFVKPPWHDPKDSFLSSQA